MKPISFVASLSLSLLALVAGARAQDGAPPLAWVGAGQYEMSGLDITPDGALLVTTSSIDETTKVWNLADGSFVRTLTGPIGGVEDVALSPDGTRLVTGGEVVFGGSVSAVLVWDLATGTISKQLSPANNQVFCVDWSPVADRVAAGDQNNAVRIWNPTTGALVRTLKAPDFGGVFDIAFSPDGTRLLAGYNDSSARIWNIATGLVEHQLVGHFFFVDGVAWSPDGARVATCSWDTSVITWTAATGALEHVLDGHQDLVRDLHFAPDGATLASASWDGTLRLWDAASGAPGPVFSSPSPGSVNAVRFSADGTRLASGGIGEGGLVLDAGDGALLARVGHHRGNILVVTLSGDQSRLVSGSGDTDARVWDAATGEDLLTFALHQDVVNAADLVADGTLAVTGSGSPPPDTVDHSVRIWSTLTGQQFHVLFGHVGGTTGVELANDELSVLSGGRDGLVKRWSVASGALLQSFTAGVGPVQQMELSPDGTRLAVTGNSTRILDAATGASLVPIVVPDGNIIAALTWSPDGTRLLAGLSAYGSNLLLYDAATGALLETFSGDPDGFLQAVAISPDGHTATCASGYSRTIRTFSMDDGTPLKVWDKETGWGIFPSLPLAYAADGRLAFGRTDATVVMSDCPGEITAYGAGCAGSGGFVPELGLSGCATAGGAVTLSLEQGLGGSTALLLFGLGQGAVPLKGCTLLLDPLLPTFVGVGLPGAGPGAGAITLPALLPPALPDVVFTLQAWVQDPGAPKGWASSNGVQVSVE